MSTNDPPSEGIGQHRCMPSARKHQRMTGLARGHPPLTTQNNNDVPAILHERRYTIMCCIYLCFFQFFRRVGHAYQKREAVKRKAVRECATHAPVALGQPG